MKGIIISSLLLFFIIAQYSAGQGKSPIKPVKVAEPPKIDGILDEDIWKNNPGISEFKTWMPDYGKDLPYKTIVWTAYDAENLYYAFRCYDSEPDKIKASVNARDKIREDDWVCINLDSFNDQQTLYCIYVNPNGIQMDTRFAAGNEDLGMDLVFYSAGKIDDQGYTVEIKLPLKSIRFSNKEPVMMAATFERYLSRLTADATYPALDPAQGMNFLTQTQPFQYEGVKHYTLLEILPALTYSYQAQQADGKMSATENKPEGGLTVKYGITSQIILDATYNPDFSQVEADAGQVDVNLRYELFYPEKRPFFQEGNENFQVAGLAMNSPIYSLVHTRNIADPIFGAKLSGKLGIKNTLSAMYAADVLPEEDRTDYGKIAHYPVLRYKRSLKGDSYIGAIGTAVAKGSSLNMVYGADGQMRINQSTMFEFNGLYSFTDDTAASISRKPGESFSINLHSEQRDYDYLLAASNISESFNTYTGFVTRTGITNFTGSITPKLYTESKIFRRFDFGFLTSQTRDNIYNKWETDNSMSVIALIGGTLRSVLRYSYSTEIFMDKKFNTSAFLARLNGRIGTKVNYTFSYRKGLVPHYASLQQAYGNTWLADILYLPFEKLHSEITLAYQDLFLQSDKSKIYDYLLARGRITYQVNKYLFFRGILEYNDYRKSLTTDFLASFTYMSYRLRIII
jgi:hypothetical protein